MHAVVATGCGAVVVLQKLRVVKCVYVRRRVRGVVTTAKQTRLSAHACVHLRLLRIVRRVYDHIRVRAVVTTTNGQVIATIAFPM